jgi:hypothetical protein
VFAQSLVEYGVLAAAASAVQQLMYMARTWIGNLSPTTWVIVAVVVLLLVATRRR